MNEKEIKDYILNYKDSYPKKSVENALTKVGVSLNDINRIYAQVDERYFKPSYAKPRSSALFYFVFFLFFCGLVGILVLVYLS